MQYADISSEMDRSEIESALLCGQSENEEELDAQYERERLQVAALTSTQATTPAEVVHKLSVLLRRLSAGADGFGDLCPFEAQTLQLAVTVLADVTELLHQRPA